MTLTRRKFTPEDRLSIPQEGERESHAATIRKYHLAPSLYARWKRKYLNEGIYGLKDKLYQGLKGYFVYYNNRLCHQGIGRKIPASLYRSAA